MDARRHRRARGGFTLLEILLVVVIVGVAAAVAMPMFARSFRGAKLRNSVRLVLTVHRHAQTKAVLGQRYTAVLFDTRKGTLEMVDQGQAGEKKDMFFGTVGTESGAPPAQMGAVTTGAEAQAGETPDLKPVLERRLEEGVTIRSFRGGQDIEDIHYVSYYPNGMCEAYQLELGDDEGRTARIQVDAVTGKAKVDRD